MRRLHLVLQAQRVFVRDIFNCGSSIFRVGPHLFHPLVADLGVVTCFVTYAHLVRFPYLVFLVRVRALGWREVTHALEVI